MLSEISFNLQKFFTVRNKSLKSRPFSALERTFPWPKGYSKQPHNLHLNIKASLPTPQIKDIFIYACVCLTENTYGCHEQPYVKLFIFLLKAVVREI